MAPEGDLPLAPEGASSRPPSCPIDSVPEGDNNVDNDNGTASSRPHCKLRSPTYYNLQSNVSAIQWVSNKQASVAKLVLDSSVDDTFSMDSWG